ncbi:TPA: hypothetical protein EYP66_23485 [Candidatus Poribacteria bacterium]|nr:hypothetical protein [Candidatus Poribacteria bacterium]
MAYSNERDKNNKPILHRRMLPFLMRPPALIVMIVSSLFGQFMWTAALSTSWRYHYDRLSLILAFAIGIVLGFIQGRFTSSLFAQYYIDLLLERIKLWNTALGKITTIFGILALGIPVLWNIFARTSPAGLQSYIFGFIGGMNVGIYLWVRKLPK